MFVSNRLTHHRRTSSLEEEGTVQRETFEGENFHESVKNTPHPQFRENFHKLVKNTPHPQFRGKKLSQIATKLQNSKVSCYTVSTAS